MDRDDFIKKIEKVNDYKNLNIFDPSFSPEFDKNGNVINHPIFELFNDYFDIKNNKFIILYFQMIVAAIYLEYKRLYKGLDIFILYREKSIRSFQKNIDRSLSKEDVNSIDDLKSDTKQDILGMKLVLNNLPDSLPFDSTDPENAKIFELFEKKIKNQLFATELKKWIDDFKNLSYEKETSNMYDGETFYNYKIELLRTLIDCSYDKFSNDKNAINQYLEQLNTTLSIQKELAANDNFSLEVNPREIEELDILRLDLIDRLNEKLENEILKVTLPKVLNSSLVKDVLKVNSKKNTSPLKFDGFAVKPDGYSGWFWDLSVSIKDPIDNSVKKIPIEFQATCERAYEISKKDHNELYGKKINIFDTFFELVPENIPPEDKEKYEQNPNDLLLIYINKLNSIKDVVPYSTDIRYKKQRELVEKYQKCIRIKPYINHEKSKKESIEYLYSILPYITAQLYATNAAHDSSIPTVILNKKKPSNNLADVLRKSDGTSVLAHMLIEFLEQSEDSINQKNTSSQFLEEYKVLLKGVTEIDIRKFAQKYASIILDQKESDQTR